jgi:YhcH/YjgK/YiaL family protein
MKRNKFLVIINLAFVCGLIACTSEQKNGEMKMATIENNTIQSDFSAKADEFINLKQAAMHFEKYPERWDAAFKFLIETDLNNIAVGEVKLNEDAYAIVSEYETKNLEDAKFESHRKNIDLQYVITGKERIGHTNEEGINVVTPYSADKDIMFYGYDGGELLAASPANYFIFFPDDKHKPTIDPETGKTMVKKVVIKIKFD